MKKPKFNINYKLTLAYCVVLALILTGIFFYLEKTFKEYTLSRIRAALTKETLLVKLFLEKDFPGYPRLKKIDNVVDQAGNTLDSRVTIMGMDGKVLGDSELDGQELDDVENHLYRPEVQEAIKGEIGESMRYSTTVRKNMLYIATLFGKDRPEGVVRLSLALSDIDLVSQQMQKGLVLSLAIGFILTILISSLISKYITQPLKEISTASHQIAGGDLSKKIPIRSKDEVGDLAAAFNHMTDQIKAQIKEINTNKKRMEAVLLSMFDGVMVVSGKGTIVLINNTLKEIFQVEADPFGKKPIEVVRNVKVQEIADRVLSGNSSVETSEIAVLIPEEKILIIHGTPIVREGRVEGAVLVFHDITELRKLERIRKDFVANVSHELRTPASNIGGYAETLINGALHDEEHAKDFLRIIYDNSTRLSALISDLMNLSKLESGKVGMDLKESDLSGMSRTVVKELAEKASRKKITITNNIQKSPASVLADENMIQQVFFNLLDNAIKYTEERGEVTISSSDRGSFVEVSIADNGIGIPEEDLPRIFERFYCVDKARSRKVGGTGLGLSIVKHIIQEHGGEVFVTSVAGQGSTFSFSLPKA